MKNKANAMLNARHFDLTAKYYADMFIMAYHLDGAERLAARILEKIRAQMKVKKEPPNAFLQDFPITITPVKR